MTIVCHFDCRIRRFKNMKKLIFMVFALLILGACSQEKANFEAALTAQLKDDKDLADYDLDAENIAECVVEQVASRLPGFSWSPKNDVYYHAYTRFVSSKDDVNEVQSALAEGKEVFGSKKKARVAAGDVSNHVMHCMGIAISRKG